ncbi:DUF6338 family protein [Paenibacillus sp. 1001270B_150601_E10]|uniref:DUF6338 family protein n=1 Tax=Paenibacillus sp. 1001270B_150601_E10 TaxID=2787079 RepID=UPI0018A02985|nr:DUF6338 family protein [Paenibacillus sp. 1001270B_150601_E10]
MTLSNFDMALYTLLFLIPGFSMSFAYGYFIPQRDQAYQPAILRFFFFSCVNFAIWWPLIHQLITIKYYDNHPFRWSICIIAVLIIFPFILGLVAGLITEKEWLRVMLHKVKVQTLHPVPTAWDYIMSKAAYTIVTLKDGTRIYGKYSNNSIASSVPNEKDLYIEVVYKLDENGSWQEIPRSNGVWIAGDQILHIEFFTMEEITCQAVSHQE